MDNFDLRKYLAENKLNEGKRDITDVKPGDIIIHNETDKKYKVKRIIPAVSYPGYNSGKELAVVDSEGNERVVSPHIYSILVNGSLNESPSKEDIKKKNEEIKKRNEEYLKPIDEIKGFEEFKETGFKLGDKVEFMGSAHPTHIKPIKLTGTIEYFEPANEIGVRVDGYGKFIPFFEIQSNIEIIN